MRIKISLIVLALLTFVGRAHADNFSVDDVTMKSGDTKLVKICLVNPDRMYVAFQFDLQLPEGISILKDNNKLSANINSERSNGHTFSASEIGENTYRFLGFSLSNDEIKGTSGALVEVSIISSNNLEESQSVATLKNVVCTTASGIQYNLNGLSFNIDIVTPVIPQITASNKSRAYGDDNPELTYTANADLVGIPTLTTTATKTSPVGDYDIVVNKGTIEGEYTSVKGTLTITKAPLTISGGTYSIKQGEALPTFVAEYSGFKNDENETVLIKSPKLETTATSDSEPGVYDVIVSGADAQNYEISYVAGKITIEKASSNDKLVVDKVAMTAGSTKLMDISMVNPDRQYAAFQFDMQLPYGITMAKNEKGKLIAELNQGRIEDHTLSVSEIGSNTYRFLLFSLTNSDIKANNGNLINITLKSDENIALGDKEAVLKSQVFTDKSGKQYKWDDITCVIQIKPEAPEITASNKSRVYGDDNPELTYTANADLVGIPTLTTTATKNSPVGDYDIVVNKGTIEGEYTSVKGTLTITKAPLTISGGTYSIKQGEALPTFVAEYSGFKNDENETIFIKSPKLETTATSDSEPGVYDVTVSGADAQNYDISYVAGTLTVGYAPSNDGLTSESIQMNAGITKKASINLVNPERNYVAFQFDMQLPEGVSISKDEKSKLQASLGDRAGDHTLSVSEMGDNTYRFLAFSMTNAQFSGTNGALIDILIASNDNISDGKKNVTIKNQVFTDENGNQYKWENLSFNIEIVTPTITAENKSRVYFEENPELTYTNNYEIIGIPELSLSATKTSDVGEYDIEVGRGTIEGKYTSVNGTLTITKAPLKVSVGEYTITEGDEIPTFTISYDGFKNNETANVLTTIPTITCSATKDSKAGEYEITVSGGVATNYEFSYTAGKLIIQEPPVTITATNCSRAYGDANPTFEYTSTGAVLKGYPSITCEATPTSNVGTYDIIISKGTVSNTYVTLVNGILTIIAKVVDNPTITLSATSYTYDGTAKQPTVTVKDGETTIPASEYTVSYSNNINVGTATVTITDAEGGNYTVSGSATFAISSVDGSLTPPVGKSNLVYNGTAQDLITAGSSTTGTVKYSLDGTTYNADIPQGTAAGKYTVYYKVEGDANHNDVAVQSFEVTIAAKTVDNPTITLSATSYTYDGTAKEPTVTVKDGETTIPASEYSVSYSNNTNVGTATVTITDAEGGNYAVSGSVTFTITKADGSITAPTGKSNLVYNGTAQDLITAGSSTTGTVKYSLDGTTYNADIPQGTAAGKYTVYYKVEGDANHNDVAAQSFEVTIAAKTVDNPSITLSATSYTYDGTAKEPTVTVKDGETTIPASEYSVSYSNNMNVGTATVTITDAEGGNYTVSGSATFAISSVDGSLTPPVGKSNLVYNGTAQDLITAGSSTTGTVKYSLDGTTYNADIPQGTAAGKYTVYYKVEGDANHNDVAAQSFEVTIAKAPLKVSVGEYTITEGDDIPSFTISYDGFKNNETAEILTTAPTATCTATKDSKAGEYEITVSGGVATNYEFSYTAGKLIIMPKEFDENIEGENENEETVVTYTITNNSEGTGGDETPTVAISNGSNVSGECTIPETVTHGEKTYAVTEIAENAFKNNTNLTDVTIPSSIEAIGNNAFSGCTGLKSITVLNETPIVFSSPAQARRMMTRGGSLSIFEGVDKETCILYVPEGSVDKYKAAEVWKEFKNILPIGSTGIGAILNTEGDVFDVYDLNGRKVKAKAKSLDGLPKGVYIVNGSKFMVK